jgi:hypothetical protein
MNLISPILFLSEVLMVATGSIMDNRYIFRGMICFRHNHYIAFFYSISRNSWILFNDERIQEAGTWYNVCNELYDTDGYPVMLFFESSSVMNVHRHEMQLLGSDYVKFAG